MTQHLPGPADDQLFSQRQITTQFGISRTQLWRLRRAGGFPPPLQLSVGIQRWRRSDILSWLKTRERSA
jgi:predicted DNA-binding transcriptional regulator AlpA